MRPSHEAYAVSGLGVGVVWWPELDALCRPGEGLVHVIEAEPETFWIPRGGQPSGFTSRLPRALGHLPQPKLLHGVGAPFGGTVMQSDGHREAFAGDIAALRPCWISDHLNFNQFMPTGPDQVVNTAFFMPPAQCPDGVGVAARQIRRRRATAGVPVAFEVPVSYLPVRPGEMPDGTFAAEVAEAADCGILLDLHNLLCNERNGRQTVAAFCASIPLERVWEIHLAGGEAAEDWWMDAHSGLVEPALMEIVADLVPRLPALGAIIFEIVSDHIDAVGLGPIAAQLGQLNDIWATRPPVASSAHASPAFARPSRMTDRVTSAMWEAALGAAVTRMTAPELPDDFADWVRAAATPLSLYRTLIQETRASALVDTAPRTIRSLLRHLGEGRTRELLGHFWRQAGAAYANADEARMFLSFVSGADPKIAGLEDDIASDRALLDQLGLLEQ